jgi:hypothetical protein
LNTKLTDIIRLALFSVIAFVLFSCKKESLGNNVTVTVSGTPSFNVQISSSTDSLNYVNLVNTTISKDTSYTYSFHANGGTYIRVDAHDLPQLHLGFKVIYNNNILTDQPASMNTGVIEMTYNHRLTNSDSR